MSTPYSTLYNKFLSKITDFQFVSIQLPDAEDIMIDYLDSAVNKFTKCKTDLSRDDSLKQFNNTLTGLEIEIITLLMKVEWLSPIINNIMLLKQTLSSSDFKIYSQSQHLREIKDLQQDAQEQADALIIKYTYDTSDLTSLG